MEKRDTKSQKPRATYEPGELQKTRRNLGNIERDEALRMMQRLGGEIGVEKPESVDDSTLKRMRSVSKKNTHVPQKRQGKAEADKNDSASGTAAVRKKGFTMRGELPPSGKEERLPPLASRQRLLFDKLMGSAEYHIRPAPGFLALLFSFARHGPERISDSFIENDLPAHIQHINAFIENMQVLIMAAPVYYKNKMNLDSDFVFRALNVVYNWDTLPLKNQLSRLEKRTTQITVEDMIPFTRELYKTLMRLYFLGEIHMSRIIKHLYEWVSKTQTDGGQKIRHVNAARQAASEWLYIFGQIVKGMYPLLMRMCIGTCERYPEFYTKHISEIMQFLKINKYDIILPKRKKAQEKIKPVSATEPSETEEKVIEEEQKSGAEPEEKRDEIRESLKVLEKLFPYAGWFDLESKPDMYPYFQPLYSFAEGFNLIAPSNPLQVTIILLRIIEDFFQGCRNISLGDAEIGDNPLQQDTLQRVFTDWAQYREVIFDRMMGPSLREYVNHAYTQDDFHNSRYAKRERSNWLWQLKYYFHPHLVFEIAFIGQPRIDTDYLPLSGRIRALVQVFSDIVRKIDTGEISLLLNPEAPYIFDVENTVSYRLNLLLGGKKSRELTNYNLVRYTLAALRVLDWWVNDKESPAYKNEISLPYRTEEGSPRPSLAVLLREDQSDVFFANLKRLQAAEKTEKRTNDGTVPTENKPGT